MLLPARWAAGRGAAELRSVPAIEAKGYRPQKPRGKPNGAAKACADCSGVRSAGVAATAGPTLASRAGKQKSCAENALPPPGVRRARLWRQEV